MAQVARGVDFVKRRIGGLDEIGELAGDASDRSLAWKTRRRTLSAGKLILHMPRMPLILRKTRTTTSMRPDTAPRPARLRSDWGHIPAALVDAYGFGHGLRRKRLSIF
ncbi:hypothetical protein FA95DRAFT_413321 [Auriscalpium vulgare]|uniref:Uncharacterized protein n=1 Tax=Auriscalpium vulgare TaxID=40419 RepID=A0ACB8S337_9AGAM|nr:hypothetical protein FA95DRAFT_413321 [Auriscalpium vulgare]